MQGDPVRTARIITGGLAMGVLVTAAVAVVLVGAGQLARPLLPIRHLLPFIWLAGVGMLGMARLVQRRVTEAARGADDAEITQKWFTGTIVGMALRESVGLVGIVLSMVGASAFWAGVFAATSLAGMLIDAPSGSDLEGRLRRSGVA